MSGFGDNPVDPQAAAAAREAALRAARGQHTPDVAAPDPGQGRTLPPWEQPAVDLAETAQQARNMPSIERAVAPAGTQENAWRSRAQLIRTDEQGVPVQSAKSRPVDMPTSDEYGAKSRHAIETINKYFAKQDCSELHFNAPDQIFGKVHGDNVRIDCSFSSETDYNRFIEDLIEQANTIRTVNELKAIGRGVVQMAGGDRMALFFPPFTEYAAAAIHKVVARSWQMSDIVARGTMTPNMAEFLKAAVRAKANILVCGEMGSGKALADEEPVLTPDGWVKISDLAPGDQVIGADGLPTTVTGVYPQGEVDLFRVTFTDGAQVVCCDDHLWQVNTPLRKSRGQEPTVKPLRELRQRLQDGAGNYRWFIPVVQPVDYGHDDGDLPLDPYLLGSIIGDGDLTGSTAADQGSVEETGQLLPAGVACVAVGENDPYQDRLSGGVKGDTNPRTAALRDLGLHGKGARTKFIPDRYKLASPAARLALLQGLLDAGGSAQPGCSTVAFESASEQLARDIVELARSLGCTGNLASRLAGDDRPAWRVHIAVPDGLQPFRLQRKLDRFKEPTECQPTRAIVSVEPVGRGAATCIKVAADDELFVCRDFIVTHNTTLLSVLAQEIADNERTAIIEEVPEIFLSKPNLLRLTYFPDLPGEHPKGLAEAIDTALYFRFQRMIVGEIHDKGMYKMVRTMSTGGDGSMSTFHAGSVSQALDQVRNHIILEHDIPARVATDYVRKALDLVVIARRIDGAHRVTEIAQINWRTTSNTEDVISRDTLFRWDAKEGRFVSPDRVSEGDRVWDKAKDRNVIIRPEWFDGDNFRFQGSA